MHRVFNRSALLLASACGSLCSFASVARAQENPPVIMQWFETKWTDMERRIPDWFLAGYGATWLPPVSRGYVSPSTANQNSTSAGYDVFDRFDLGTPTAQTAYGTEAYFDAVVSEFHLANGLVYIDSVMNHNTARMGSIQFQQEGGYSGFWMAPSTPIHDKTSTESWGDFHTGTSGGYYQSENPSGARYCLWNGDLVNLVDIDQASNNFYIRHPTTPGNAQNIPAGTYFNKPIASNARFYPDPALGTDTINNPGMSYAGPLNTGNFAFPCDVSARNESASQMTRGRYNLANPMAGVPYTENATGLLLRWTQWMMDVHHVDGFRIDAIKHTPSWFFDTFWDAVVSNRRVTPDGRHVTPYSFGESVESNDFTFDRYVRKPNGRASGRNVAGDAFGNRDCLDLNGAGALRDLVNGGQSWGGVVGAHLDNVDDGYNNGTVGVNHIWSHDNGTTGDGSSVPPLPSSKQQGWFAHSYLLMRPGQAKVYHNGAGITRTGSGFYPKQGVPVALGLDYNTNAAEPVITNLVKLSHWLGRGEYQPRYVDGFVNIFERTTNTGAGYVGNCIVGSNRSYDNVTNYDERVISSTFPAGTRLVELTGNATNATVDPSNQIFDVITVGSGGSVTIRVPRNKNTSGVEHNRGFVVYAPALPSGTITLTNIASTLPADPVAQQAVRRRLTPIPVITANSFQIQFTTTNGDSGAGNNNNADDNAVFRINAGYQDWNGNGISDIDYNSAIVPGYEQFVTVHQPLAGTTNTIGQYAQTIDATRLPEGINYISVVAFRKRNTGDPALFREFRAVVYIDRQCPAFTMTPPAAPVTATSASLTIKSTDRTSNRFQVFVNQPSGTDLVALANANQFTGIANRVDRMEWNRVVTGLHHGVNSIGIVAFEETGHGCAQSFDLFAHLCPADVDDGSGTGVPDGGVTIDDLLYYLVIFTAGDISADIDDGSGTGTTDGGVTIDDLLYYLTRFANGC